MFQVHVPTPLLSPPAVSKKILLIISILAAGLFSAFAWMLYLQTPQFVLGEMQRALSQTKTVRFFVDVAGGDGAATVPPLSHLLTGLSGQTVQKNGSFSLQGTVDVDLHDPGTVLSETNGRAVLRETGKEPIEGSGRYITEGEKRALRLDRVPTQDVLVKTALQDRWVTLPPTALHLPFLRLGVSALLLAGGDEKVRSLFRKTTFFHFKQRLADGKDNGNETYTYAVSFRPEALKAFVVVLTTLQEQRSLNDDELSRLDADLAHWQVGDMQLSIRKRDFVLQQLRLEMHYQNTETHSAVPFTLTFRPTRWNQPLQIAFPKEVQSIRGALTAAGVTGLSLADGRPDEMQTASSTETVVDGFAVASSTISVAKEEDEDHDGLTETLEVFYGTDARNPDTDGDGYQDGYEVNHGFNPTGPGQLFGFGR